MSSDTEAEDNNAAIEEEEEETEYVASELLKPKKRVGRPRLPSPERNARLATRKVLDAQARNDRAKEDRRLKAELKVQAAIDKREKESLIIRAEQDINLDEKVEAEIAKREAAKAEAAAKKAEAEEVERLRARVAELEKKHAAVPLLKPQRKVRVLPEPLDIPSIVKPPRIYC